MELLDAGAIEDDEILPRLREDEIEAIELVVDVESELLSLEEVNTLTTAIVEDGVVVYLVV